MLGNESEAAVTKVITLRQHLQPYIHEQMERVSKTGQPINRPLFWDFQRTHTAGQSTTRAFLSPLLLQSAPRPCATDPALIQRNATMILPCLVQPFLLLRCASRVLH